MVSQYDSEAPYRKYPIFKLILFCFSPSIDWLNVHFYSRLIETKNVSIGYEAKRKINLSRSMITVEACKNSSIISHILVPLLGWTVLPSLFDRHLSFSLSIYICTYSTQLNPPGSVNMKTIKHTKFSYPSYRNIPIIANNHLNK